jgi:UDP-N-acetylmuramoylalanine--D-glutamate ligase
MVYMYLIYWKWKVGLGIASLCDYLDISYEICDDTYPPTSYDDYEAIIPSPGVPPYHAIYETGKVISELDFACQYLPSGFQTIAVTGTDGKSTTSWILFSILQKEYFGKKSVYLSGNFDIPFSATLTEILKKWEKKWIIAIEVSSFMAHSLHVFSPDYAIFTNFRGDHLNWHKWLQDYLDAKMHIVERTKKVAVMNQQILDFARENSLKVDIPDTVRVFAQDTDCHIESYRSSDSPRQDRIRDCTDGEDIVISGRRKYKLSETELSWSHNAMNILAVCLIASQMKICSKRVRKYLTEVSWLPHRLEKIGEKRGIVFVEDSKSTSSQSLEAALGSYSLIQDEKSKIKNIWADSSQAQNDKRNSPGSQKNLLLIVWGSDKWDSFEYLADKFNKRVKAMVCIGATKDAFIAIAKSQDIPFISTDILTEWVEWLYDKWSEGDVLMLSPGCASFWLFRDYLDRAHQFRSIVAKLPE